MDGYIAEQWAFDDRLVDLSDTIGHFSDLFDPDQLDWATLLNAKTGQKALYGAADGPDRRNHVHVWKSLLEQAGFTLDDIPKEWDAFWSFWCDQVQPACARPRAATTSGASGFRCRSKPPTPAMQFVQFMIAYEADYVTHDGKLVIDDPEIRQRLVKAIDSYTAIYRKGCTPPDSVTWADIGNNEAFLAQAVVMTPNHSLSIPNALKSERPDDYYENTATIEWPLGPSASLFRSSARVTSGRGLSTTAPTSPPPRSSSVSSWPRAGSLTISTSPASACCRRCRSCSTSRSGSTRATRTAWPR